MNPCFTKRQPECLRPSDVLYRKFKVSPVKYSNQAYKPRGLPQRNSAQDSVLILQWQGFSPGSGNQDLLCCAAQHARKEKKKAYKSNLKFVRNMDDSKMY